MTPNHSIDVEAERKLFEAEMRRQYGADILLARHADGPYIAMAWRDTFDGWLAAKRSMAQPTNETGCTLCYFLGRTCAKCKGAQPASTPATTEAPCKKN